MDSQHEYGLVSSTSDPSSVCPEMAINATTRAAKGPVTTLQRKYQRQRSIKCHVIGCKHNLVKAYDKKARTCSHHRKESQVELEGVLHRFCQQCSRFHPLTEFDGERKNCRQRLQQHNRRQRRMRKMRRPDGQDDSYNDEGSHQSQYTMYKGKEGSQDISLAPAATAVAGPSRELQAFESPMLSEIAATDDTLLSSVELDSLLGPFSSTYDGSTVQQRMLLEISNAVIAATEACNALIAEDMWHDEWFKPALGSPTEINTSPFYYGGGATPGGLY